MVEGSERVSALRTRAALIAGAALLSGCASLGGNIKGSFSCKAPDGTCAPATAIDDSALSQLESVSGGDVQMPSSANDTRTTPTDGGAALASAVTGGSGRSLRVVFPAYVDRFGRLHDKTAVQASVSDVMADVGTERVDTAMAPATAGLLGAAEGAPEMFADAAQGAPAPVVDAKSDTRAVASVGATKVAGAKPAPAEPAPSPIDSIKADVARRVATQGVRKAPDFPGTVE